RWVWRGPAGATCGPMPRPWPFRRWCCWWRAGWPSGRWTAWAGGRVPCRTTERGGVSMSFWTGLGQNVRVVAAVVAKEWRVFWRYPMNAAMSLLMPLTWLAPVYFMGQTFAVNGEALGFRAATGTGDFVAFMVLGGVVGSYVRAVFWGIGFALKEEMEQGTLESLWLTPNSRLVLLVGRSTVSVLITSLNTVGVMLAVYFLS